MSDQSVDLLLTVTKVTTKNVVVELSWAETTSWVAELEWPEEVGGLLEVGADGEDLVDQIFHTDNTVFSEVGLDDGVVGKSNALLVDLSVTTLVDELTDGLEVRVTISDPWLNNLEHLEGSLGHTNEDTVVDLKKTEELENLARLGCDLVDTLDTDNEDQLGLSWDVERTRLLGDTSKTNLLPLLVTVLLDVLLSTLEDDTTLLLVGLLDLLGLSSSCLSLLGLTLALLQKRLRDENLLSGWGGSVSNISLVSSIHMYGEERREGIAAIAQHSRKRQTRL